MLATNGMRTSEFWLAVIAMVICGVLIFFDKLDAQDAIAFAGIPASYILSRGFAKVEKVNENVTEKVAEGS